jgi:hypothetical protein
MCQPWFGLSGTSGVAIHIAVQTQIVQLHVLDSNLFDGFANGSSSHPGSGSHLEISKAKASRNNAIFLKPETKNDPCCWNGKKKKTAVSIFLPQT